MLKDSSVFKAKTNFERAYLEAQSNLDSDNVDRDTDFISSFQVKPISIYDSHFSSFMILVAVTVAQHRVNTQPVYISLAIHLRSSKQPRTYHW